MLALMVLLSEAPIVPVPFNPMLMFKEDMLAARATRLALAEVMFRVNEETLEVRAIRLAFREVRLRLRLVRLRFIDETFLVRLSRVPLREERFACREVFNPVS